MKKSNERDRQTVHFLKWIKKYPGWWQIICTPDDEHMNIEMMKMLIKRLAEEEFYEIIFVLLMVHRNEKYVKSLMDSMLLKIIIKNWNGKAKDKEKIIKDILQYFS
ncbi:MAG: hypothetical protein HFH13_05450 [Dorea sp.]|nr:hypothetical protein [Dorea sp.]